LVEQVLVRPQDNRVPEHDIRVSLHLIDPVIDDPHNVLEKS